MANPQLENGYIKIANELWDALMNIDLSRDEWRVIRFVWRMSYGCKGHKVCQLNKWVDLEYCAGVHRVKIKAVLKRLADKGILVLDWKNKLLAFNKRYDTWNIKVNLKMRGDRYKDLLGKNLGLDEAETINKKLILLTKSEYQKVNTINSLLITGGLEANDSVPSEPLKDNNNIIYNKRPSSEKTWLITLVNSKCGSMWQPQSVFHEQNIADLLEYPRDMITDAFSKTLASKPEIKPPGVISYVLSVIRNGERLKTQHVPAKQRKTKREQAEENSKSWIEQYRLWKPGGYVTSEQRVNAIRGLKEYYTLYGDEFGEAIGMAVVEFRKITGEGAES